MNDKYIMPGPNEVRFVVPGQTLSLVMGSCISTVFIGRGKQYVAAANHIMIARQRHEGIIAKRDARQQIDEILDTYDSEFAIKKNDLRCLHLVGAGRKIAGSSFHVHEENVEETQAVLSQKNINVFYNDTGSHFFASYSLDDERVSVFIEDKISAVHLSYIINLERLFDIDPRQGYDLPASALKPNNRGFEKLVEHNVVVFITGERERRYE